MSIVENFAVDLRSPGDSVAPPYALQVDGIVSYVVGSSGEANSETFMLISRPEGIVSIRIFPTSDVIYYVECLVSSNPEGTLIWGAQMGDGGSTHSQPAQSVTEDGRTYQFFSPPSFPGSPDGSARFWFTMQDGATKGTWSLRERISVIAFQQP